MQSAIRIAQGRAASPAASPLAIRARRLSAQSAEPHLLRRDSGSLTAAVDAPSPPRLSANRRGAIFPGSAAHEAVKVLVSSPLGERLSKRRSAIAPGTAAFVAASLASAGPVDAASAKGAAEAAAAASLRAYESSCSMLGSVLGSDRNSAASEASC